MQAQRPADAPGGIARRSRPLRPVLGTASAVPLVRVSSVPFAAVRRNEYAGPASKARRRTSASRSEISALAPVRRLASFSSTGRKWSPQHGLASPCSRSRPAVPCARASLTSSPAGNNAMAAAAQQLVDDFVRSSMSVGVGGGVGSLMALQYLASKVEAGALKDVVLVPGSATVASEIANFGIPMTTLEDLNLKQEKLDLAFSDADTIQEGTLYGIIGRRDVPGRGSLVKEKALARAAKQFVVIVPGDQFVEELQGAVPVEIQQFDWLETAEEVDDIFIGDAEVWRRPSSGEAGPMGGDFPFVTEGGHFVLDLRFEGIPKPEEVAKELGTVPGVVEHGILLDEASAAAVAFADGVKIRTSLFRTSFTS